MGEILSVDSTLDESSNLWWIKIGLPWIEPTTSDLSTLRMVPVRAHTEKDTFQVRSIGVVPAKILGRENQYVKLVGNAYRG